MSDTINIPFDGRTKTYDRDQLATALLVFLDQASDGDNRLVRVSATANILHGEHAMTRADAIACAVGARICDELGIDPYGNGRPTR